jgi:hypothetical protein
MVGKRKGTVRWVGRRLVCIGMFVAMFLLLGQDPGAPIGVPTAVAQGDGVPVPELPPLAVAVLLASAMLIGWRVRRRVLVAAH